MSLNLYVDGPAWRHHLNSMTTSDMGLVPVIKGNGYGFGLTLLARQAQQLGTATIAVHDLNDAAAVRPHFHGTIMVMSPWLAPHINQASTDISSLGAPDKTIHTLGHIDALNAMATSPLRHHHRMVVEGLTSMHRHGIALGQLPDHHSALEALNLEGFAFHLPLLGYSRMGNYTEAQTLLRLLQQLGHPRTAVWLSHLDPTQMNQLRHEFPQMRLYTRVGTSLWLGDRLTYRARADVLDVRRLAAHTAMGYRQTRMPRSRTVLIVSGGTTHGVGLTPVNNEMGLGPHLIALAKAARRTLMTPSPFLMEGRHAPFAEPPHLHVSAIVAPRGARIPNVGDQIGVRVRMTVTTFDQVHGVDEPHSTQTLPSQISYAGRYVPLPTTPNPENAP